MKVSLFLLVCTIALCYSADVSLQSNVGLLDEEIVEANVGIVNDGPAIILYQPDGSVYPLFLTQLASFSVDREILPEEQLLGQVYTFTFVCQSLGDYTDAVYNLLSEGQVSSTFGWDHANALKNYLDANFTPPSP